VLFIVTYPSNANGLSWSLPVEAIKHIPNNRDAVDDPSASAYAILVVSAYGAPPVVVDK
jgi:hypothetical protein